MDKKSFLLYLGVGFAMTLGVWGLMGGCSSEKGPLTPLEEAPTPQEQAQTPPSSSKKLQMEETAVPKPVVEKSKPAPKVETASNIKKVQPPLKPVAEVRVVEHVVQKGETLWAISQKYRTVVEEIMELNQMKNMNIQVGQRLRIKTEEEPVAPAPVMPTVTPAPVPAAPVATVDKPAKKEEAAPQPYSGELLTHEVKDGETLATIATQYQTSKAFLLDINGLTENSQLQVGQILLVPEKTKP